MREKNSTIEEYIDFTSNKIAITKIKDTSKEFDIKLDRGIIFYFLMVISIVYSIFLPIYIVSECNKMSNSYSSSSLIVAFGGMFLFLCFLIGVTIYEGKKRRFRVSYINNYEFKINKKIYNIEKQKCSIDVRKHYETQFNSTTDSTYTDFSYYITISKDGKTSKKWEIPDSKAEEFRDFIHNFDYEILEEKQTY